MKSYVSTGTYVLECDNPLYPPVTGVSVVTGYISQNHADALACDFARSSAEYLRSLYPCPSSETTTTTTTPAPLVNLLPTFPVLDNNWNKKFKPNYDDYYDLQLFGEVEQVISGSQKYGNWEYFVTVSANDLAGDGTVLTTLANGRVTGYGKNYFNLLDVPTGMSTKWAKKVSLGYDHCLVVLNDYTITGWGRDSWGALSVISGGRTDICTAIALNGGSLILTTGGLITGSTYIQNQLFNIPFGRTGAIDIGGYDKHGVILFNDGLISGVGYALGGATDNKYVTNPTGVSAGVDTSIVFDGDVSGWGTVLSNQKMDYQNIKKAQLTKNIGYALNESGNLTAWGKLDDFEDNVNYKNGIPIDIYNSIVEFDSAQTFNAAIKKRNNSDYVAPYTGSNLLWRISSIANQNYGNLSLGALYRSGEKVVQPCDAYTFYLPYITGEGDKIYYYVPDCSVARKIPPSYSVEFTAVKCYPHLNINYYDNDIEYAGRAATGITDNDYWNSLSSLTSGFNLLKYSDGNYSRISGGHIITGYGLSQLVSDNYPNNMVKTALYCPTGLITLPFYNVPSGIYNIYCYGRGSGVNNNATFSLYTYGASKSVLSTSTGDPWDGGEWENGLQYVVFSGIQFPYTYNYFAIKYSGYLNGIQICNLTPFITGSGIFTTTTPITGLITGLLNEGGLPITDEDGLILIPDV